MHSILRLPDVMQRTGLSRASIYLLGKKDKFPKPIKLGERSVGWTEASIQEWIELRIVSAK